MKLTHYDKLRSDPSATWVLRVLERAYQKTKARLKNDGAWLFAGNAIEILYRARQRTFLPVQAEIAGWLGDTKVRRESACLIPPELVAAAIEKSRPGDVVFAPSGTWRRSSAVSAFALLAALSFLGCGGREAEARPAGSGAEPSRVEQNAPDAPIEAMRERVLASLELRPGMSVAEIGLGRGWFVFRSAQAVGRTGAVYATDIDPEAISAMERVLPQIDPAAAPVTLRLCRHGRDTALDDLPEGTLDVVLMIDSLCFDGVSAPHSEDVPYLRRFLRVLRPGGRLVHHMDCNCGARRESVEALFREAGFDPAVETVPVPDVAPPRDWPCRTDEARARQAYIGVFRKPQ